MPSDVTTDALDGPIIALLLARVVVVVTFGDILVQKEPVVIGIDRVPIVEHMSFNVLAVVVVVVDVIAAAVGKL